MRAMLLPMLSRAAALPVYRGSAPPRAAHRGGGYTASGVIPSERGYFDFLFSFASIVFEFIDKRLGAVFSRAARLFFYGTRIRYALRARSPARRGGVASSYRLNKMIDTVRVTHAAAASVTPTKITPRLKAARSAIWRGSPQARR